VEDVSIIGQYFEHHRGRQNGMYKLLDMAVDEATQEPVVIYENTETGVVFVRSASGFFGNACGLTIPRFSLRLGYKP